MGPPTTFETAGGKVVGVMTIEPELSSVTCIVTCPLETAKVTLVAALRFMAAIRANMI
ncbi:MAG: hypothetical protein K0S45_1698 [Nitrospira sp.]|nr:hypothetical protein [Nitrospira sp.]